MNAATRGRLAPAQRAAARHARSRPSRFRLVAAGCGLSLAAMLAPGPVNVPWVEHAVALTLLPTPDVLTMSHDRVAVVAAPGVLGNDIGIGGNTRAILESGPTHGVLVLARDGGYTYTPAAAYVGTDQFRYHPTGCLLGCSTTVTITIRNFVPVAAADAYPAIAGSPTSIAAPGVLGNDQDGDGDALVASLTSGVAHGSLSLAASGAFTYTANAGYSGTDTFAYRAWDGVAWSGAATVTMTVSLPPPVPTPTPTLLPTSLPTLPPTPLPSIPLPIPLPSLPLPPTPGPSSGSPPTPAPSVPPTLGPSVEPGSSLPPSGSGSTGGTVPPGAGSGTGGLPGDPFTLPPVNVDPLEGTFGFGAFDGFDWAVPALVITVPGLLLMLAILGQTIGMLLWLPIVRRWRRGHGARLLTKAGQPAV